jgi:hypothetical protein
MTRDLDLDVDAPDQVPGILRAAVETYLDSRAELQLAWQDKKAGEVWAKIARELERVADKIEDLLD